MNVSLDKFDNSDYDPGAKAGKRLLWYIVNAVVFASWLLPYSKFKVSLLRIFGAKIGRGVVIKPKVNVKYPWLLEVGDHCWIGEGVWIDNLARVSLGNHVCLSQGAYLLTGNHNYKSSAFDLITGKITIKQGAWVGAKSTVSPGVVMGECSVLAVGSVATHSTKAYGIYQGNPAQQVKERIINEV